MCNYYLNLSYFIFMNDRVIGQVYSNLIQEAIKAIDQHLYYFNSSQSIHKPQINRAKRNQKKS